MTTKKSIRSIKVNTILGQAKQEVRFEELIDRFERTISVEDQVPFRSTLASIAILARFLLELDPKCI
jgi:hypothetical protein